MGSYQAAAQPPNREQRQGKTSSKLPAD